MASSTLGAKSTVGSSVWRPQSQTNTQRRHHQHPSTATMSLVSSDSAASSRPLHHRSCNTNDVNEKQHLSDLSFVVFNIPHRASQYGSAGGGARGCSGGQGGAMRTLAWVQTMKLPLNAGAFHTLTLRRISNRVVETMLREVSDIVLTPRDKRCVQRLWSTLCLHEPLLMQLPFIPYLCTAVARCIPNNPVAAFESAMHFLLNMCAEWIQQYPSPPNKFIDRVDHHLHQINPDLWEHLQCGGVFQCSADDYLWLPLQTFFLYSFGEMQWTEIFCDVVCRSDGMQYFYALAVSLLSVAYASELMRCDSRKEVHKVVTSVVKDAKVVEKVRQLASTIALQLCLPVEPIIDVPSANDYYPILHVGRKPPIPVLVDKTLKLMQIEADEEELHRRLKVELSTLTATADVARFHRGVMHAQDPPVAWPEDEARVMLLGDCAAGRERMLTSMIDVAMKEEEQQHALQIASTSGPSRVSAQPRVLSVHHRLSDDSRHHVENASQEIEQLLHDTERSNSAGHLGNVESTGQLEQQRLFDGSPCSASHRDPSAIPQQHHLSTSPELASQGIGQVTASTTIPPAVLTAVALLRAAERRSQNGSVAATELSAIPVGQPSQLSRSDSLGPTNSAAPQQSSKPSTRSNSHTTPVAQ